MNENLIGIFDSGVGGLSVLKKLAPFGGNYIYFGDTKNLPYGNKTKEQIIDFTRNIVTFFMEKGAKNVIMACNTSSALAYDTLKLEFEGKIKIHPLIQTASKYIKGEKIGVMATEGTVKSGAYTKEILKSNPNAEVFEIPCPGFVEIVENRLYDKKESISLIKKNLEILLEKKCDKIVLGCTHYPYLMPILTKFAPKEIFINPAEYMTEVIKSLPKTPLKLQFFVSLNPEQFRENAKLFMEINEPVLISNSCFIGANC